MARIEVWVTRRAGHRKVQNADSTYARVTTIVGYRETIYLNQTMTSHDRKWATSRLFPRTLRGEHPR